MDHSFKSSYKEVPEVEKYYDLKWNTWTAKWIIRDAQKNKGCQKWWPMNSELPHSSLGACSLTMAPTRKKLPLFRRPALKALGSRKRIRIFWVARPNTRVKNQKRLYWSLQSKNNVAILHVLGDPRDHLQIWRFSGERTLMTQHGVILLTTVITAKRRQRKISKVKSHMNTVWGKWVTGFQSPLPVAFHKMHLVLKATTRTTHGEVYLSGKLVGDLVLRVFTGG